MAKPYINMPMICGNAVFREYPGDRESRENKQHRSVKRGRERERTGLSTIYRLLVNICMWTAVLNLEFVLQHSL